MENEFMALWSTHWKYAVVGVGVLILLLIIICIICKKKVPCCSSYEPVSNKEDGVRPKHVGTDQTTLMQNNIWNAISPLQEGEGVYFHYTSKEVAPLIAQSGFKVSDLGMQGTGVYFSVYPPVYVAGIGFWPHPKFPQWPNPGFKEALLRLNYGDAATDEARQNLVDAVIIVKAPANIAKDVTNRPGAVCIADKFYAHNNEPFMMKSQIVKIVELF